MVFASGVVRSMSRPSGSQAQVGGCSVGGGHVAVRFREFLGAETGKVGIGMRRFWRALVVLRGRWRLESARRAEFMIAVG